MKRFLSVLFVLAMAQVPSIAQDERPPVPNRTPRSGYWVVENNLKTPRDHFLYFYNDDHVLIYKESIEGVNLNLKSARVKRRLKRVLEKSLVAWQKQPQAKENEGLVKNLLRGN